MPAGAAMPPPRACARAAAPPNWKANAPRWPPPVEAAQCGVRGGGAAAGARAARARRPARCAMARARAGRSACPACRRRNAPAGAPGEEASLQSGAETERGRACAVGRRSRGARRRGAGRGRGGAAGRCIAAMRARFRAPRAPPPPPRAPRWRRRRGDRCGRAASGGDRERARRLAPAARGQRRATGRTCPRAEAAKAEQATLTGRDDEIAGDIAALAIRTAGRIGARRGGRPVGEGGSARRRRWSAKARAADEAVAAAREARATARAEAENQEAARLEMERLSGERFQCSPPVLPGRFGLPMPRDPRRWPRRSRR